ncbi:uncharacterized protein PFLUO_LOCUS1415 [Penicillium psychrofluorescens]|uniref:uncharacterized protein n=1 Tax=Penicillium psychrofluorescens TaxID=3158075 RepID=UPI003CCE093F
MRSFTSPWAWATIALAFSPAVLSGPVKRTNGPWLAINSDFPDPSFLQAADGVWYAFGTNGNGHRIQVANSTDFVTWTLLDIEALPTVASWELDEEHWAPDVILRDDGKYVMYYSGDAASDSPHHCVGTAIADAPAGPYVPSDTPLSCRLDQGGSIDPSGFLDSTGTRYVVFKVDGNSIGHGGDCNNMVDPIVPTPIMLQEVAADGVTPVGDAVQILDRTADDGPLVEAPNLILQGDTYFLFYSSYCFTDPQYSVKYATAPAITGPYTPSGVQLVQTGDYGLTSPGGATVCGCGQEMVFHGFCGDVAAQNERCMYAANVIVDGTTITLA